MHKAAYVDLYPLKDGESDSSCSETEAEQEKRQGNKKLTESRGKDRAKRIRYDIKVKTSGYSDKAESIAIRLIGSIAGKQIESGNIKLNNTPSDNEKEKFLKDSLDLFKSEEDDVGSVSWS